MNDSQCSDIHHNNTEHTVLLCWVSFYWTSLRWVSWHRCNDFSHERKNANFNFLAKRGIL